MSEEGDKKSSQPRGLCGFTEDQIMFSNQEEIGQSMK
jgi:hypothetical protein